MSSKELEKMIQKAQAEAEKEKAKIKETKDEYEIPCYQVTETLTKIDGETWEHVYNVYGSEGEAAKYSAAHKKWWGDNLVVLGVSPLIVNGHTYYQPGFNVWD